MDATFALAAAATAFALGAGFSAGSGVAAKIQRRERSASSMGFGDGFAALLLRDGIGPLRGPVESLLRLPGFRSTMEELVDVLRRRSMVTSPEALGTVLLASLALVTAVAYAASSSFVCAAAVCICTMLALVGYVKSVRERREAAFREEIPDVIRSLIVCFGAGMTLLQASRHLASEFKGVTGALFEEVARTLETGGSAEEALSHLRGEHGSSELAFVAVALDVQHRSGGGVVSILESAKEAAQEEIDLRRAMRVQTAQARLSARIVTAMPFVLVALFSFVSEGFLEPFFASAAGLAMLCVALLMQAAGVIAVRQMLKVA